jgi:hypothetical protein
VGWRLRAGGGLCVATDVAVFVRVDVAEGDSSEIPMDSREPIGKRTSIEGAVAADMTVGRPGEPLAAGGKAELPSTSLTEAFRSLRVTIDCIDSGSSSMRASWPLVTRMSS